MSEIVTYDNWYNYAKSKYQKKARICYMDTDSFIVHVKSEDIYTDLADYVLKNI